MSKIRSTIYVEKEKWQKFKEICIREGEAMSEKIENWIQKYVGRHEKGNPQTRIDVIALEGGPRGPLCFHCREPASKVFFMESGKLYGCNVHSPRNFKGYRMLKQ